MKLILLKTFIPSILASVAGISYQIAYESALNCDFSKLVNPVSITMATTIGCILISLGNLLLIKLKLSRFKGWYFIVINIFSMLSIIGPTGTTLPFDIQSPELFPGLIAPLHLLPALSYITISTFFKNE
jgi:hypothetical protein